MTIHRGPPQFITGLKSWATDSWTTIRARDIDSVLSFDTPSVVRVRDRYLGAIYHSLRAVIFLYIVGYQILWKEGYLQTESPQGGNIRVTVSPPAASTQPLPYCQTPGYNCTYSALGLNTDESFPFIPTTYNVKRVPFVFPNCSELSTMAGDAGCIYPNPAVAVPEQNYFFARAEDYGVTVNHTVAGLLSNFSGNLNEMKGALVDGDGKVLQRFEVDQPSAHYVIPLRNLLRAARVDVDPVTGVLADFVRRKGVFLLVYIKYAPLDYHGALKYEMTVNKLGGENTKPSETYFANPFPTFTDGKRQYESDDHYTVIRMHGITLQVRQVGKIGAFNLQTLLINLVAGSALLRLAKFLVEILMVRFMPQRAVYCKYKYHETEDFGDYRKAQRHGHELAAPEDFPGLASGKQPA